MMSYYRYDKNTKSLSSKVLKRNLELFETITKTYKNKFILIRSIEEIYSLLEKKTLKKNVYCNRTSAKADCLFDSKLEKENRICKFCNLRMVEDEFHFLLKCPLYSDIRHNFIDNIQRNCENFHHLSEKKKLYK